MAFSTMLLFLCIVGTGLAEGCVKFVDGSSSTVGNGTSWDSPFNNIQDAIDNAEEGDEVWVKQGSYHITSSIVVDKPIKLYGKFTGSETRISQRPDYASTYIDGLGGVYPCLRVDGVDAVIDGFYIINTDFRVDEKFKI